MYDFPPAPGLFVDILRFLPAMILVAVLCTGYKVYDQPQSPPRVTRRTAVLLSIAGWLFLLIAVVIALAVIVPTDSARSEWYGQQSISLDVSCLSALDQANTDAGNQVLHVAAAPAFTLGVLGFILSVVSQSMRGLVVFRSWKVWDS